MPTRFSTILIPVDFSLNTEVAISRAIDLVQGEECHFHLFHVHRIKLMNFSHHLRYLFKGYSRKQVNASLRESKARLTKLKESIEERESHIRVSVWASFGEPVEKAIADKAMRLGCDLIVIGKNPRSFSFFRKNAVVPSRLAASSGVPVLSARPGSLHREIKTVVIPVDADFPSDKLEMLSAIQQESTQVKLAVFVDDKNRLPAIKQSLLNTFRTLKNQSSTRVNYDLLNGKNKAKTLLIYCRSVGADLLIMHTGMERRVRTWSNNRLSDLLPASSAIQVLALRGK